MGSWGPRWWCSSRPTEHEGIIERAHDDLERSFLPGRTFTGAKDFNHQLQGCRCLRAHAPDVGLCAGRSDRRRSPRDAHIAAGGTGGGWRCATRLARDHYVRLDSNDYSVHPAVIGRRIEVRADLDRIQVFGEGVGRWGEVFGDDVVAAAMIDRLVHHAEVIALKGDFFRIKDRDLGRVPGSSTEET